MHFFAACETRRAGPVANPQAVAESDARLREAVAEAEARLREAVAEREARLAALAAEREGLARQVASLSAAQADDRQERDALRLRVSAAQRASGMWWCRSRTVSYEGVRAAASRTRRTCTPPVEAVRDDLDCCTYRRTGGTSC